MRTLLCCRSGDMFVVLRVEEHPHPTSAIIAAQIAPASATLVTASPAKGPRRPGRTPASDSNEPQARAGRARRADGTPAHPRPARRPARDADPSSLALVFVVAANPKLPPVVLVAALRRPIEEPVVGH